METDDLEHSIAIKRSEMLPAKILDLVSNEDAVEQYEFNVYVEAMYDLIWRDFCDWYLESIKPTVQANPHQQQVLRTVLSAILRMLHPICPFVTEALWPHLQATGEAGLDGVELPRSEMLAAAAWPEIASRVEDAAAASTFERVQALTSAIRALRADRQVPPRRTIRISPRAAILEISPQAPQILRTLAGAETVEECGGDAIPLAFEGQELRLEGLVEAVDVEAEQTRLTRLIEEKERAIAGFRNRLANTGYVTKAPDHVVQRTQNMLGEAEADLAAARAALSVLESK